MIAFARIDIAAACGLLGGGVPSRPVVLTAGMCVVEWLPSGEVRTIAVVDYELNKMRSVQRCA